LFDAEKFCLLLFDRPPSPAASLSWLDFKVSLLGESNSATNANPYRIPQQDQLLPAIRF
jgi:hypothetical protein